MAVATGLAIAGLAAGALGAKKQADATKKAASTAADAARFNPYNVNSPFGNVSFGADNSVRGSLSPEMEQFRGLFGDQALQYLTGNSPTQGFQSFANQVGTNQMPQLFGQAIDAAGYLPTNEYSKAMGLFNQDTSGLVNSKLDLLRQQAAPQEQRQMDMLANSAFSRGQLGGPGGRLALQQFQESMSRADLGRQDLAQQLGMQQQVQNMNMGSTLFGAASNMSNMVNSRAQQRLQNATGLFGFGQEMNANDFNRGQGLFQNMQGMDENMRNWIALGGNIGGTQASAGANMGGFMMQNSGSPGGAFLGSLGTGLMDRYIQNMPMGAKPAPTGVAPRQPLGSNWWEGPQ